MAQEFTGERYLHSEIDDQISVEHKHRYQFASMFTLNKATLDLGCGSGYGSLYLKDASSYLGIDVSPETIAECELKYSSPSKKFQVDDAQSLNLPNASFDVVTCFEVLEHVERPEDIVSQAARVLNLEGIFISSTPDIDNYNSVLFEPNPFHINEMSLSQYRNILSKHFRHNQIIGQYFCQSSFILDSNSNSNSWTEASDGKTETNLKPLYWIGVSSNFELPPINLKSIFRSSFSRNLGGELVQMKKQADIFHNELKRITGN